ncbi:uncharacterized protein [Anabrus simplex]|uniref:uncharacterized protein n=1 Tax=Anabrus simplex TaxID=316456 RepID=UPI0035A2C874
MTTHNFENHLFIISFSVIFVAVRPLWVQLLGENKPLSADNPYELSCQAVGTRPAPVITWLKGSISLRNTREQTSPDGNETVSILTFVPTMEDSGKILTCRAGTPLIPDSYLEDVWKLNIYHVPIVSLELGSNLNGSTIREGVDVYFECNIKSNPWVYKVSWRHNGKTLFNNASMGTIVSNQSLGLQSVTRSRAGLYTCVGSNQEGDGESNPVYLDVKFAPVCKPSQQKVHGVARQEAAKILCELEANPTDVHFVWKFNNTSETVDIQASHVTADRTRSVATYTPMTELDYGTLLCWGRNELGMQKEPCVFHIIPAGKPDPLHNCTILNQTAESLHVECSEGFDGGLPQEFVMEVYDAVSQNLVTNVTSRMPMFTVNGLESGLGFDISLFASNAKGRSDPVPLHAYTLKAAEKRTGHLAKPDPPDKCTIVQQTFSSLRVACNAPSYNIPTTYVLQAYDARTRRLIASATSQTPGRLEVTDLPPEHSSLVLTVRTVTAHATSDAHTIYTQMYKQQEEQSVATPTILHITPILGVLIGVVLALVLVAVIIVVVMRLRGHSGDDEKDREEGSNGVGRRNTCGDKASSVPLSKDTDESMDSLDEKNPDIIPQNSDTDYQDPDEKAFEKLNNTSGRIYANVTSCVQSPNNGMYDNNMMTLQKTNDEVTYAELSLPKQQPISGSVYASSTPHMQVHPTPIIRRQEPTVYAQIDVTKKVPLQHQPEGCLQQSHPASLPLLHHHHLAAYHQPPLHMLQQHSPRMHEDEPSVNAETPLIPQQQSQQHRESTVAYTKPESGRSSASQGPRVTATRF